LFANVHIYSFSHAALCFSQVLNSVKKLIHSLSCCKPTMQTNCGLMNCTGNSPEFWNCFFRFIFEACKILSQL